MLIKNKTNLIIPECPDKYMIRITYTQGQFRIYPCCAYELYDPKNFYGILTKEDILNKNVYNKILISKREYNRNNKALKQLQPLCNNIVQLQNYPYRINGALNKNYLCDFNKYDRFDSINVSIQHTCNLNCIMCNYKHEPNSEIDELYFLILEQLRGYNLKTIQLTQEGEPFYYKKRTLDYLQSLTTNDCQTVFIISNITLLNDEDIETLSNLKVKIHLIASIDGVTEETYKKIRRNNLFNKVMHNAELLIQHKILKSINFVVQELNTTEIPLIIEYCRMHNIKCNLLPLENENEKYREIINDYTQKCR